MTLPVEFPDIEALLVDYLDPLHTVPVRTTVPNPRPGEFVLVRRSGGVPQNPVSDGPLVIIEAWAQSPAAAYARLAAVRRELHALPGTQLAGHPVYRVVEVGGPADLPDPVSSQARYTMLVQLSVRGYAPAATPEGASI